MTYYLYAYINKRTGLPYYIGKGKDKRAFKKHGRVKTPKDKRYIIFMESNLTEIGALALERRYIAWYGREDNNTGVLKNLTDGGDGVSGHKHSQEFKDQVGEWARNLPRTKEHCSKISLKLKGVKKSEESIVKMKKTKKEKNHVPWNKGKTLPKSYFDHMRKPKTEETKAKISESIIAKRKTCEHCNKLISSTAYTRFHGENCKFKPSLCEEL